MTLLYAKKGQETRKAGTFLLSLESGPMPAEDKRRKGTKAVERKKKAYPLTEVPTLPLYWPKSLGTDEKGSITGSHQKGKGRPLDHLLSPALEKKKGRDTPHAGKKKKARVSPSAKKRNSDHRRPKSK